MKKQSIFLVTILSILTSCVVASPNSSSQNNPNNSTPSNTSSQQIVIEDDGVGFDLSEKKKDGKVHVGLSSVRDRLNYYCRGTIHVYCKIGEGSKITISIPKSFGGGS